MPSCAVTSTLMALAPASSAIASLAVPLSTALRLPVLPTFTLAFESLTVGVSLTWVTAFATVAV